MPYVTLEQIEHAKQMDLLTYLQYYEPNELPFSTNRRSMEKIITIT